MAQIIAASIYRIDGPGGRTEVSNIQGVTNYFPTGAGIRFYPQSNTNVGAANATTVSVIEMLPTGNNQIGLKFYSTTTAAALQTAANAALA